MDGMGPKTLERAKLNLSSFLNTEFELADITDFVRADFFDIAYSVLTFMHIEDKAKAFKNIYESLKKDGLFVLSVSKDDEWLDYGSRKLKLFPNELDEYILLLQATGFHLVSIVETESKFATIINVKK